VGDLFRVTAAHVPPMPGVRSPLLWGSDAHLQQLFAGTARIEHRPRHFAFRYKSPEHFLDVFRAYYGPTHKAFAALDAAGGRRSRPTSCRCSGNPLEAGARAWWWRGNTWKALLPDRRECGSWRAGHAAAIDGGSGPSGRRIHGHPGAEALAGIRDTELRAAAAVLGVCEVMLLDYSDQALDRAEPGEVIADIARHLRRIRPAVVVTFGPDGAYGHPDHVAVHHGGDRRGGRARVCPATTHSTTRADLRTPCRSSTTWPARRRRGRRSRRRSGGWSRRWDGRERQATPRCGP
jgi:hypothetical protein